MIRRLMPALAVVALLLLIYPKPTYIRSEAGVRACNCIGIDMDTRCLGVPFGCAYFEVSGTSARESLRYGNDIAILLDRSQSMAGGRLGQAKDAAESLAEALGAQDRLAVIAFDRQARLLTEFTNSPREVADSLETVQTGGDTFYLPAIRRAADLFWDAQFNPNKKIIVLSDGEPSSQEDLGQIYDTAYEATAEGICIYTVGFGVWEGTLAEEILRNLAAISQENAGCGKYYRNDGKEGLESILYMVLGERVDLGLEARLIEPAPSVYNETTVPFVLSTNTDAVCEMELNQRTRTLVYNHSFRFRASPGKNVLKVTCRKSYGRMDEVEIKREFYVRTSLAKNMFRAQPSLESKDELTAEEVRYLLSDVVEQEQLIALQRVSGTGNDRTVYLIIENNKPVKLKNVYVTQEFGKRIAAQSSQFSSSQEYQVTGLEPLSIDFYFAQLLPGEQRVISYQLDNFVSTEDLRDIRTIINYDKITNSDLMEVAQPNQTSDLFSVKSGYSYRDGKTEGRLRLSPKTPARNVRIYLKIPKCMAYHINQVHFQNSNYRVVSSDPVVFWSLDTAQEMEVGYSIDKELEDECEREMQVLTIGEPVAILEKRDSGRIWLVAVGILGFVLMVFLAKTQLASFSREQARMLGAAAGILILAGLVFVAYPKPAIKGDSICSCFGIGTSGSCYGIRTDCTIPASVFTKVQETSSECRFRSCSDIRSYMLTDPLSREQQSTDLVIVVDRSKSMEGRKIEQAKAALGNLILESREEHRIALVQFDESAQVVQGFTLNKTLLREKINAVELGGSTAYQPALITAHSLFVESGERRNQWQAIFVSDGAPGDRTTGIYRKVREMAADEICINTLGFGQEVPGTSAEEILREMARQSSGITDCGLYEYSGEGVGELTEILGRLYDEAQMSAIGLEIAPEVGSLVFDESEPVRFRASVKTPVAGLMVPGSVQLGARTLCSPEAELTLMLTNLTHNISAGSALYDRKQQKYIISPKKLPVGSFDAYIAGEVRAGSLDCQVRDRVYLGRITIEPYSGFGICQTDDCFEINRYLFSEDAPRTVNVFITDYAFVPQNISVVKGTTMVWKNIGSKAHTVTSGRNSFDGRFHSGILLPGESFNYTFHDRLNQEFFDNLSKISGGMNKNRTKNYTFGNFSLEYKKNIDMTLLVDRSGSMSGKKIDNVKTAASQLVRSIYPGDRLAIVRFGEDANIANTFSSRRSVLLASVERLYAAGRTFYLPALDKIYTLYRESGLDDSGRIVILLSDGEPWDSEGINAIYSKIQELVNDGICVFAIGYGDEVTPGSKPEAILQRIVEISQDSTECGSYKYSPSDSIRLTKIFGSVYHDAIGGIEGLILEPEFGESVIHDNETYSIRTRVKSSFTNTYLPGYINSSGQSICGPPAKVTAELLSTGGRRVFSQELAYTGRASGYTADISGIKPGRYIVELKAESVGTGGESCNYFGVTSTELRVLPTDKVTVNWYFAALFGLAAALAVYLIRR